MNTEEMVQGLSDLGRCIQEARDGELFKTYAPPPPTEYHSPLVQRVAFQVYREGYDRGYRDAMKGIYLQVLHMQEGNEDIKDMGVKLMEALLNGKA